jgi:hypothetical protein
MNVFLLAACGGLLVVSTSNLALSALQDKADPTGGGKGAPGGAGPGEDGQPTGVGGPLVKFPSPLITEILYAVPTGESGDASKDGNRSANGDEFIEIVNPHDKPIELKGWTLSDKRAMEKNKDGSMKAGAIKFVFPTCTLKPGQTAVVFNGYQGSFKGPCGDQAAAAKPNDDFGKALVFSMKVQSRATGLANTGDWVLLSSPEGKPVSLVWWGKPESKRPEATLVEESPANPRGSVQRPDLKSTFQLHPEVDGVRFSPGIFKDPSTSSESESASSTPKPSDKPEKAN